MVAAETRDDPSDAFYTGVPVFDGFASIMDPGLYRPLPDDWVIGLADVVASTQAIAEGRYKIVNTAGAAVIAAVANALGAREFPFVFGGDGASFAVPFRDADVARKALAETAAWVRDDLDLTLRTGLVPVAAVRAEGLDVRVARFAPSPNVTYAMFSGGGLAWAEREMKRGGFAIPAAPPGARPDLNGLSCRWREMPASRGIVLSVVVAPVSPETLPGFRTLVEDVIALVGTSADAGRPIPDGGPTTTWPSPGLDLEARALRRRGGTLLGRKLVLAAKTLASVAIFRFGISVGGFVPGKYRRELVENSDFRKYDDTLRMTVDCTPALADRIQARLAQAQAEGVARFGLHRQGSALMTCIVPSVHRSDHVHFVDGAAGGYASAARELKSSLG
jgi:hypothetical protein